MKISQGKSIRWHALLSLILSTISFTLGVITIFSSSNNGILEDYYFLRASSNLGQSLVEFAAVNSTTANTTSIIDVSALDTRALSSDSIEKRDAASDFATALFGNVIKEVKSIVKKIEPGDNDGLNEAEKVSVSNITDTVGVADFYSLTQLTSSTPSTFRVVNTTLTVPLLGLATTAMPFTAGMLNIVTIAILALYGLALIGSGATIVLSAIYMFKPTARIVYCALFFFFLASNFTMTVTLDLTAVTSMVNQMVSLVGPAPGVEASVGGAFLGSSWIAATFALIFNQYWSEKRTVISFKMIQTGQTLRIKISERDWRITINQIYSTIAGQYKFKMRKEGLERVNICQSLGRVAGIIF
ncbi:hypothetical protein EAF00_001799 [Botryotinia globosa]|nr:hypothetical protein EAF00_001799 [Botryotinia globosa]